MGVLVMNSKERRKGCYRASDGLELFLSTHTASMSAKALLKLQRGTMEGDRGAGECFFATRCFVHRLCEACFDRRGDSPGQKLV